MAKPGELTKPTLCPFCGRQPEIVASSIKCQCGVDYPHGLDSWSKMNGVDCIKFMGLPEATPKFINDGWHGQSWPRGHYE
jgi:hypothetical protein